MPRITLRNRTNARIKKERREERKQKKGGREIPWKSLSLEVSKAKPKQLYEQLEIFRELLSEPEKIDIQTLKQWIALSRKFRNACEKAMKVGEATLQAELYERAESNVIEANKVLREALRILKLKENALKKK
ncbi:hypothetical protein KJ660_04190 [Candidatus Micrarchaeota archaeon]|nr:hypothetical protein [Candidatus Micrarchaeota archaeon]